MSAFVRGSDPVDLILTAGAASTDPLDPCFLAIDVARRSCRAAWRAGPPGFDALARTDPADGDPRPADVRGILEGDRRRPAAAATPVRATGLGDDVAKLGHGGILTRTQRFRFPPYAREFDAPDG